MAPQLPEHALVSLLQQCFIVPSCRTPRIRRQPLFNSSRRAPHNPRFRSHLRHRQQPRINAQPRCQYSRNALSSGGITSSALRIASLRPEELQEHVSATVRAGSQSAQGGSHINPQQIAILGGGITGLSAAHYLSREVPAAHITIYEGSEGLGGWLNSEQVDIGNGHITVEQGPRTLRANSPAGLTTLEMIQHLGLQEELLVTHRSSAAALNRFIYYPDRLARMPGPGQDLFDMAWRIFTEPVFKGLLSGAFGELVRDPRPDNMDDESVASFLTRRLGSPRVADNIVSAVLHGIYAGDVYQLSAKSLMGKLRHDEEMYGSLSQSTVTSFKEGTTYMPEKDIDLQQEICPKIPGLISALQYASVYSFKQGIGALTGALEDSLRAKTNVSFKLSQKVTSLSFDAESDAVKVKTSNDEPGATFDKVISTISGRHLSTLTANALPTLAKTHAVTVMVVNLFFTDPNLLPERGFGYLIPRSIPYEQNPECALGVVFDSDAVVGQDTATGTKVTVMLGGHWWDGLDAYPDEEEGGKMALAVLQRHLKIDKEPAFIKVGLQRECIPQYTVGHESRMASAHSDVMSGFKGKLLVAGNSYNGVGLNDCVRSAREVVMSIKNGKLASGLEDIGKTRWTKYKVEPLGGRRQ